MDPSACERLSLTKAVSVSSSRMEAKTLRLLGGSYIAVGVLGL